MTLFADNYDAALKYGALIRGKNMREGAFYGSVSANTNGTAIVPVFGSNPTTFEGTLTNINIIASGATKGTIYLVSDQGTLVTLVKSGSDGGTTGSFITPIAFQNGSQLYITSAGTDNANVEVNFYTFA